MSRQALFAAVRPFAPGRKLTDADVSLIDMLADQWGMRRSDTPSNESLEKAVSLIKQFEGCKLTAYPDPASGGDPWTIGWGSTGPGIAKGVTWTQAQADARAAEDVAKFMAWVDKLLTGSPTTPGQRAALTSFAYNVGTGKLASSTLLKLHIAGNHKAAQGQFARWNKAAGREMAGLTRRRAAEAAVYGGAR